MYIASYNSHLQVLLVSSKEDGRQYALKVMEKRHLVEAGSALYALNEMEAMQDLRHPFLMHMYGAFQDQTRFFYLLEYVGGGDLFQHVSRLTRLPEEWASLYAAEIALALDHIHKGSYLYRDLKLENVLIATDGHAKLGDFGLARKHEGANEKHTMAGTPSHMAPEVRCDEVS